VKVLEHAPFAVEHVPTILPPSVVKFTVVPSGAGLLKWSESRAVSVDVIPSMFHPSILRVEADKEKLS